MSDELSYQQVLDLLPAYTLGALEPDEMLAVSEYLGWQRSLLDRLNQVDAAVAQLALAAPDQPPPPIAARAALMSRVRAELGEPGEAAATEDAAHPPASAATPSERPSGAQANRPAAKWGLASGALRPARPTKRIRPAPPRRPALLRARPLAPPRRFSPGSLPPRDGQPPLPARRRAFPLWPWIVSASVAAVALLVTALAAGVLYEQTQDLAAQTQRLRREIEGYVTQIGTLDQQIGELEQRLTQEQQRVALFPETDRVILINGTEGGAGIRGAFYQRGSQGVLTLHGLVALPEDQVYQLWLIPREGAPAPAGVLSSGERSVNYELEIPDEVGDFTAVGVSIEPAGGSAEPTGPIVAFGQA